MIRKKMMSMRALVYGIAAVTIALSVAACQQFGPLALEEGRQTYNDSIHKTSQEQLFANLVRIANAEPPLFMDVTEVDAAQYIQGSLTGGATGIGGKSALQGAGPSATTGTTTAGTTGALLSKIINSTVGSVGGGVTTQESPTIRYQPLIGNALIQQISTPIVVGSIANLITSDWPFLPLLDLTTDSMTPEFADNWAALNAIAALDDDYGALTIVAGKSAANRPNDDPKKIATGTAITIQSTVKEQGTDALVLYLEPNHPRIGSIPTEDKTTHEKLLDRTESVTCSNGVPQPPTLYSVDPSLSEIDAALLIAKRNIMHLWIRLLRLYKDTQVAPSGLIDLAKGPIKLPQFLTKYPNLTNANRKGGNPDAFYAALDDVVGSLTLPQLDEVFGLLPRRLDLRTDAVQERNAADKKSPPSPSPTNHAPMISTHSALGTLLYAVGNNAAAPGVEFVTPAMYKQIIQHAWNSQDSDFYTLLAAEVGSGGYGKPPPSDPIANCVDQWVAAHKPRDPAAASQSALSKAANLHEDFVTLSPKQGTDFSSVGAELALASLRRYVLIVVADQAPSDAYVAYREHDHVFYVDVGDRISRKNLALLSQIMTMQAIPSASPALTPSINVGAQ
jgi:hypothetical protein